MPKGTKVLMFGGKGGVGKTTCAAATALHYAEQGQNVLLISTDPTPSLGDIFELDAAREASKPWKVHERLELLELGPEELGALWERKFGREVYEVFASFVDIEYDRFVEFITTVLPGLGEEFMVDQIRELASSGDHDLLIWDTAPLGQTLGLLRMPGLLREHLRAAPRIYSRLRVGAESRRSVLQILKSWEELSATDMAFLRDEVEITLVVIPEALAVRQLERIVAELQRHGLVPRRLIVNQVARLAQAGNSDFLEQKARQQEGYLRLLRERYPFEIIEVPLFPGEIKGLAGLERVRQALFAGVKGRT